MSQDSVQEPIYDERVKKTIKGLLEGRSREELAEEFKLSSWKSLDIYMRRKGFSWDGENKRYIPTNNKTDNILEELASDIPVKAEQIIRKFELRTDIDPRELAKDMGFDSHREMAEYMEQKGLIWNSELGNYEKGTAVQEPVEVEKEPPLSTEREMPVLNGHSDSRLELLLHHLPLLQMLSENKDRLLDLLMPNSEGHIPKYAVPGVPKTKSIYMSDKLARLVTEFSESKNLSQREIVEAAMIEYLKRYGYQLEVERLLEKS